jgi:hypothetical protein
MTTEPWRRPLVSFRDACRVGCVPDQKSAIPPTDPLPLRDENPRVGPGGLSLLSAGLSNEPPPHPAEAVHAYGPSIDKVRAAKFETTIAD